MRVVGLGAQNTFEDAQAFTERHGLTSVSMLWDGSLDSWAEMGVTGTPAAILFDRQGRTQDRWVGPFDESEVLDLARRA